MAVELRPLPETFPATRDALHRVAEQLVAPARKPHNEIALRRTPGGFGTPEFEFEGRRTQVRIEGVELVLARDGDEERAELTSIAAGGALLGPLLLPDAVTDDDSPLDLDPRAADGLAAFYAFAAEALERVKSDLGPGDDPSDTNLWPEHFDIAFEAGSDAEGEAGQLRRVSRRRRSRRALCLRRPVERSDGRRPLERDRVQRRRAGVRRARRR